MSQANKPPIRYTSRDFDSIKLDLVNFIKRYYPDTFKDFQAAGFGSMVLDSVAYVGDILSFYLDYQVNESFLETATELDNVIKIAQQMGYRYEPNKTSTGMATFFALIPAQISSTFESGAAPNYNYAPVLRKGTRLVSKSGIPFILTSDVDFADRNNEVVVAKKNASTGRPIEYAIKGYGRVISGRLATATKVLGNYKPFQEVIINDNGIVEIISLFDSNGNEYFEVPNLAQDVIYYQVPNNGPDREFVQFMFKPRSSPRRFETFQNSNRLVVKFGYGSEDSLATSEKNILPSRITMDLFGKNYVSDTSFDPNTLLKSGKFGVAPSNTTLKITYRTNVDANVNIPSAALTTIVDKQVKFSSLASDANTRAGVTTSIEVTNEEPITGDISPLTSDEIKVLAANTFFAQDRAVTANDYKNLCYLMPSSFGGIKRAAVYKDHRSLKNNINIYILAEDRNLNLTTGTASLKENLKTWLATHKPINESIDILDAKIVNIKIDFVAVAEEGYDKSAVLTRAERTIRKYLSENPNDIGDPIYITKLTNVVNEANGVADVISMNVDLKRGLKYSRSSFNLAGNISADGRKIFIPKNVIWEVKFPFKDINGEMR